jgi:hypothetical protein
MNNIPFAVALWASRERRQRSGEDFDLVAAGLFLFLSLDKISGICRTFDRWGFKDPGAGLRLSKSRRALIFGR